jgi:hypothetical protein
MNALLTLAAKDDDSAKFSARDLEIFVNLYKAQVDKFNDKFSFFEEVKGRRIYDKYQSDNYYEASGTLANSCMAEADSSWLEPYTDNNTVSLVIFKSTEDEDMIIGRAILWECLDGKKVMDRIYTNNDSDVELFRQYAKESGWWYKSNNNSSNTIEGVGPEGQNERLYIEVQLRKDHRNFPYMDTMKYYYPETGIITNSRKDTGFFYYLEDTDGEWSHSDCKTCNDSEFMKCPTCNGDGEEVCIECNGDGEIDGQKCPSCDGEGKKTCSGCNGDETIACTDCEQYR